MLWHTGDDIPSVPNKRTGGYCLGGKITPIFFNTLKDSEALPTDTGKGSTLAQKMVGKANTKDIYLGIDGTVNASKTRQQSV